jgi:hypothetical protein
MIVLMFAPIAGRNLIYDYFMSEPRLKDLDAVKQSGILSLRKGDAAIHDTGAITLCKK